MLLKSIKQRSYLGNEGNIGTHTVRHVINLTCFFANFGFIRLIRLSLDDFNYICDPKWRLKCARNFRAPPWILMTQRRRCVATMQASVRVSGTSLHAAKLRHKMVPSHHCIAVCCSQHIVLHGIGRSFANGPLCRRN